MAKKKELADVEQLREDLLICRKNGYHKIPDERVKKADAFCEDYKEFLDHSKTEREAVKSAIVRAEKEGFVAFDPKKSYKAGDKVYYNNRGKALILAVIGKEGCKDGVRIAAAHIDSPRLDLKPHPLYEKDELALFKSHYYGGRRARRTTVLRHRLAAASGHRTDVKDAWKGD